TPHARPVYFRQRLCSIREKFGSKRTLLPGLYCQRKLVWQELYSARTLLANSATQGAFAHSGEEKDSFVGVANQLRSGDYYRHHIPGSAGVNLCIDNSPRNHQPQVRQRNDLIATPSAAIDSVQRATRQAVNQQA